MVDQTPHRGSVTAPVAWPCGYINMPLPQLKFSEGLTISAWARLLTPNPWSTIFSLETPTVERSILWVGVEKDSKTLRVDIPGDVGGGGFIKSPFTGYDPQFAHVALVWDPENAQTRLYLNGAQAAVGVIADDAFNITNRLTDITLVIGPSKYDGHRVNSWDGQVVYTALCCMRCTNVLTAAFLDWRSPSLR